MNNTTNVSAGETNKKRPEILLALLPFWPPMIPPMGISCLKSALQAHGFPVKTIDGNTEERLREPYFLYMELLKKNIPADKTGNLYNIGNDVLQNHMMTYLESGLTADYPYNVAASGDTRETSPGDQYLEVVKTIIYKTF
ncbi:MAG: hypothetical protein GY765_42625, partial [bacterium]|nr:hypothetical protein [bacterium]